MVNVFTLHGPQYVIALIYGPPKKILGFWGPPLKTDCKTLP